jgi:hypothetical protein
MNVIHTHTHTHRQITASRGEVLCYYVCMYVTHTHTHSLTHTHTHTDDGFTLDMQAKGKFDGGVPFFFLKIK